MKTIVSIATLCLCISVSCLLQAQQNVATLYEHDNYHGKSQSLAEGFTSSTYIIGNDELSSIRINPGYSVTLYEHSGGKGRSVTLTEDVPSLRSHFFNDKCSSLKVEKLAPVSNNELSAGSKLGIGDKLYSADQSHYLVMQEDGNLCVYTASNGFKWCSMASGFKRGHVVMQTDGNLVVYDGKGRARWSTETTAYFNERFAYPKFKPVKLVIKNDGTLNLLSKSGISVWNN